jgi:hypothetical protein
MNLFSDALNNTILPFDVRVNRSVGTAPQFGLPSGNLAAGTLQIIAVEVLVSKLIRIMLRMENKSFGRLILVHSISMPLIGGLVGFADAPAELKDGPSLTEAFMGGAKAVPAVFMAQYITNTALQGLHVPKLSIRDILITAASKILTRPLLTYVYGYMPEAVQSNFDANDDMVVQQVGASRLKRG